MAAERTEGILKEPRPFVHQKSLDDFCITYELNVYTGDPNRMAETYSDLHRHILDAFNEHNVQIMSPHYESDPGDSKVVQKRDGMLRPRSPTEAMGKPSTFAPHAPPFPPPIRSRGQGSRIHRLIPVGVSSP